MGGTRINSLSENAFVTRSFRASTGRKDGSCTLAPPGDVAFVAEIPAVLEMMARNLNTSNRRAVQQP